MCVAKFWCFPHPGKLDVNISLYFCTLGYWTQKVLHSSWNFLQFFLYTTKEYICFASETQIQHWLLCWPVIPFWGFCGLAVLEGTTSIHLSTTLNVLLARSLGIFFSVGLEHCWRRLSRRHCHQLTCELDLGNWRFSTLSPLSLSQARLGAA